MLNLIISGGGRVKKLKTFFKKSKILAKISGKTLLNICLDDYKCIKNKYLIINEKQNELKKSIFIGNHFKYYLLSLKTKIDYLYIYNKRKIKFINNNK